MGTYRTKTILRSNRKNIMRTRTIKTDARELAQRVSCMANDNEMLRLQLKWERDSKIEDSLLPEWTPEKIKDLQDDAMFWEMKCQELLEILAKR